MMLNNDFLSNLSKNINDIIKSSPAADLDKNLHALIQGMFSKVALISREEFDIQAEVLKNTRFKLELCEKKLQEIEASLQKNNS